MQTLSDAAVNGAWRGELCNVAGDVCADYNELLGAAARLGCFKVPPSLVEAMSLRALATMLQCPERDVVARAAEVNDAMTQWRNPELLFRYLEDNMQDEVLRLRCLLPATSVSQSHDLLPPGRRRWSPSCAAGFGRSSARPPNPCATFAAWTPPT